MKKFLFFGFLLIAFASYSQKKVYQFFNAEGKQISYKNLLNKIVGADIVFFGELHNNPISHWFELQLVKDLYELKKQNLIIGCEMFEADNQLILDEYMQGLITTKKFEEDARLWPNYKTDYKPIVEFAKQNNIKFIATNIPRRYAGIVAKNGFEGLEKVSEQAKSYIAPLPIKFDPELKCYKQIIEGMPSMMHGGINIAKAQAIKDATMSYFILKNFEKGKLFFHFNGAYHSDWHQGIVWYIKQQSPDLKIITITTVLQKDLNSLEEENKNIADFILVVPEDMITTY